MTVRRRWSYSLRTFLVVVTLAGSALGYALHWKLARHEIMQGQTHIAPTAWTSSPRPNLWLRLIAEKPVRRIIVGTGLPEEEFARIGRLFPEADMKRILNDPSTKVYVFP